MTRRALRFLPLACFAAALLAAPDARAQSCAGIYRVEQAFPAGGPEQTRWLVCWQMQKKHGLVITSAHFRTAPGKPWVRVFWDARVAEIFVPYHGNEDRFYDVMGFDWPWVPLIPTDCPAALGGTLLGSPPKGPDVCKIVHDRGLLWKDDKKVRRGEELVLWGAIDAWNYNYLVEWTFRDDGVVLGRVAATGPNYPPHPLVAHMHSPTWRLDIDLDGWPGDSAYLGTHTETGLTALDTAPLVPTETGIVWDPLRFHALHVHDASLKNGRGSTSMFHLMPIRFGSGRHDEAFTKQDFWVTRYKPTEIFAEPLPTTYVSGESVANTDIVVWYTGSIHHLVRDEDGEKIGSDWVGEAHAMWVGFMLKPHNLFDTTPFFP